MEGAAPGAPILVADWLGVSEEPRITFADACQIVGGLPGYGTKRKAPKTWSLKVGPCSLLDMPFDAIGIGDGTSAPKNMTHLIDIIPTLEAEYDWEDIQGKCRQQIIGSLPDPFRPKGPCQVPFVMQLVITDSIMANAAAGDTPKQCLIKHFFFDEKVSMEVAMPVIQGTAMRVNWGANSRGGPKALQYMLTKLGGRQVRYWAPEGSVDKEPYAPDDIDKAYDYIHLHAPRSNGKSNDIGRFIKKVLLDKDSPPSVAQFTSADVRESIKNLREGEICAETTDDYPLFLQDVEAWYMDAIIEVMLPTIEMKSVIMLGRAGVGKTPIMQIIASAWSRRQKKALKVDDWRKGEFRTASSFDFFRLEKGLVTRPDLFDDGDTQEQAMAKHKAFADQSLKVAQTKERWGAASWPRGQLRMAADNKYDPFYELTDKQVEEHRKAHPDQGDMPYEMFVKLIRPAFPAEATPADVDAMTKRSHFVVHCAPKGPFEHAAIWFREAGVQEASIVRRIVMQTPLLLKARASPILKKHSKGIPPREPDTMTTMAEEEQNIMSKIIDEGVGGGSIRDAQSAQVEESVPLAYEFSKIFCKKQFDWGGMSQILDGREEPMIPEDAMDVLTSHRAWCENDFERTVEMMRARLQESLKASETKYWASATNAEGEESTLSQHLSNLIDSDVLGNAQAMASGAAAGSAASSGQGDRSFDGARVGEGYQQKGRPKKRFRSKMSLGSMDDSEGGSPHGSQSES